jgi:hypothetical protein
MLVRRAFQAAVGSRLARLLPWFPGSNVQGEPPGWGFQHVRATAETIPFAAYRALRQLGYDSLELRECGSGESALLASTTFSQEADPIAQSTSKVSVGSPPTAS